MTNSLPFLRDVSTIVILCFLWFPECSFLWFLYFILRLMRSTFKESVCCVVWLLPALHPGQIFHPNFQQKLYMSVQTTPPPSPPSGSSVFIHDRPPKTLQDPPFGSWGDGPRSHRPCIRLWFGAYIGPYYLFHCWPLFLGTTTVCFQRHHWEVD